MPVWITSYLSVLFILSRQIGNKLIDPFNPGKLALFIA